MNVWYKPRLQSVDNIIKTQVLGGEVSPKQIDAVHEEALDVVLAALNGEAGLSGPDIPFLCAALHELKVLRWREKKMIEKIHEYEQVEDEETLYLNGTMMDMEMKDTPFARIQKLQEALYKVQGRAATIAGALRQAEENDRRYELERERLELARMKATGEVEVDDAETVADGDAENLEDG